MTTHPTHNTDVIHLDQHRAITHPAAGNPPGDPSPSLWAYETPTERGEAYIHVMRDVAEATHDRTLRLHHDDELTRILRPLARMTTTDLTLFLEGVHNALQIVLEDLISARNRNQPTIHWPNNQQPRGGSRS